MATVDTARLQTDQSYRADLRNQGYFVGSEGGQVYAQQGGNPATGGGGSVYSPSSPQGATPTVGSGGAQLASGINSLLGAIASGNKQAFDEAVRQFNTEFGLKKDQFAEDVRQFNQNYLVSEAGLTGTYQGQQTQQAQQQAFAQQQAAQAQSAGLTGYYQQYAPGSYLRDPATGGIYSVDPNGTPTLILDPGLVPPGTVTQNTPGLTAAMGNLHAQGMLTQAAQQQQYTQQMGMIAQAASLQANPFRQQQAIGQMGRLLGGGGVAGFSAPNTVQGVGTAGGNTQGGLGYLSQLIQDIRDPTPNQTSMNDVLNGIPTPNKLNSNEFLRAAPSTQSMVLQGMQEKYGIPPEDSLNQIKATLPQFVAPTTYGTTKR